MKEDHHHHNRHHHQHHQQHENSYRIMYYVIFLDSKGLSRYSTPLNSTPAVYSNRNCICISESVYTANFYAEVLLQKKNLFPLIFYSIPFYSLFSGIFST